MVTEYCTNISDHMDLATILLTHPLINHDKILSLCSAKICLSIGSHSPSKATQSHSDLSSK